MSFKSIAETINIRIKAVRPCYGWCVCIFGSLLILLIYAGIWEWTVGGDKVRYIGRGNEVLGQLLAPTTDDFDVDIFDILFLIPNVTLAAIHNVFGDRTHFVSILLNAILYIIAFVAIVFYVRERIVGIRPMSVLFAVCVVISGFGLPGEVTKYVFNSYSSDVIGLFVSTLALIMMVIAINRNQYGAWIAALSVAVLALLTRPSGIVWIAVVSIGYLASCCSPVYRNRIVLAAVTASCVAAFLVWPYIVYTAASSMGDIQSYGFQLLVERFSEGTVITGRVSPYFGPLEDYPDYVLLMMTRFVYYFIPFREGYSQTHILVNICTVSIIIVGLYLSVRWFNTQPYVVRVSGSLVFASVIFTGIFYAATQVEDWRYYLAVWPSLWFLVAIGLSRIDMNRKVK